jgi:hypothetical protein
VKLLRFSNENDEMRDNPSDQVVTRMTRSSRGMPARLGAWAALVSTAWFVHFAVVGCGAADRPRSLGDSAGNPQYGAIPGSPCVPEGAARDCHVTLGEHDGVLSCFVGKQTCSGGVWSDCGGQGSITGQSFHPRVHASGKRVDSLTSAANCTNDPCDPTCQIYNETPDAGIVPDGGGTVIAITGGSLANSNVPPGFQGKGNDPSGVCSTCAPGSTSTACQEACMFDMTCNTNGTNGCTAFGPGQSGACTGIDITVPVTCESGSNVEVSVCNRGTQSAPPGVLCYVYPGGSPQYPNANPGIGTLVMTTQTTIAPGACETQAIPDSLFPAGGTESLMCNPPNTTTTTTSVGPKYPTVTQSAGAWVNTNNAYAADGVDATLSLTTSTQAKTFSSSSSNVGWTNVNNAEGTSADGTLATAAVTAPLLSVNASGYPSSNTSQSGTWTNPTNAYTNDATHDVTTTSLAAMVTVPSAGTVGATTTTADTCNGSGSSACVWQSVTGTVTNNDARNAEGSPDGSYAQTTLTSGDDAVAFLGGYDFTGANAIPSNATISSITATVTWHQSHADNKYTGGIAIYAGNGATMVGSECTSTGIGTSDGTMSCAVTGAQISSAGLTVADLTSAKFIRIHGNHASSGSSTSYTIYVDDVTVQVQYSVPSTASILYKAFGLNTANAIPANATINSVTINANLEGSASNTTASVSLQAYKNGYATAIGTATTITNPPTSLTLETASPSVAGLTAADFTDANFGVVVTASASTPWTFSLDYIQVVVNWSEAVGSNQTVTLTGFGFDSIIPSTATIESVTTEVDWKVDVSGANETLGVKAVANGTVLGTELKTPAAGPPTSLTVANYAVTSGVTASQLYDANNFNVQLRATSTGGSNFNASVDYVKVTVVWSTTQSSTMTLGNFGFNIPSTATITGLTLGTKWSVSASNQSAQLGIQAYAGATAIGSLATTTAGSPPPTSDTVFTTSPSVTGLTPASFADGTFAVNVQASRGSGSVPITASVDYVTATVTYTTSTNSQIPECNYNNDWSVSKQNPALACTNITAGYGPSTYTQTYTSSCPAGTHTQWAFFSYDATTPSDSSGSSDVKFQVQTAPVLLDGGVGAPTSWITVANTPASGDPAVCPMSGPSPCPKDLFAALGGAPGATNGDLTLQVTLTPSPDGQVAPTLNSWQITYSCPPSE